MWNQPLTFTHLIYCRLEAMSLTLLPWWSFCDSSHGISPTSGEKKHNSSKSVPHCLNCYWYKTFTTIGFPLVQNDALLLVGFSWSQLKAKLWNCWKLWVVLLDTTTECDLILMFLMFRWRGKCPWVRTWWACRAPPTATRAPPLTFPQCTQKPNWLVYVHASTWIHTDFCTHKCCNFLFHWTVPATLCSQACVDFIIWCVIKAESEPASAELATPAGIMDPLCGCASLAHRPPDVYLNVQNMFCRFCNLLALV